MCFQSCKVAEISGLSTERLTAVNAQRSLYPTTTQLPRPYNGSPFKRLTQGALLIHRRYYLAEQPFGSTWKGKGYDSLHEIVVELVSEQPSNTPCERYAKTNLSKKEMGQAEHKEYAAERLNVTTTHSFIFCKNTYFSVLRHWQHAISSGAGL